MRQLLHRNEGIRSSPATTPLRAHSYTIFRPRAGNRTHHGGSDGLMPMSGLGRPSVSQVPPCPSDFVPAPVRPPPAPEYGFPPWIRSDPRAMDADWLPRQPVFDAAAWRAFVVSTFGPAGESIPDSQTMGVDFFGWHKQDAQKHRASVLRDEACSSSSEDFIIPHLPDPWAQAADCTWKRAPTQVALGFDPKSWSDFRPLVENIAQVPLDSNGSTPSTSPERVLDTSRRSRTTSSLTDSSSQPSEVATSDDNRELYSTTDASSTPPSRSSGHNSSNSDSATTGIRKRRIRKSQEKRRREGRRKQREQLEQQQAQIQTMFCALRDSGRLAVARPATTAKTDDQGKAAKFGCYTHFPGQKPFKDEEVSNGVTEISSSLGDADFARSIAVRLLGPSDELQDLLPSPDQPWHIPFCTEIGSGTAPISPSSLTVNLSSSGVSAGSTGPESQPVSNQNTEHGERRSVATLVQTFEGMSCSQPTSPRGKGAGERDLPPISLSSQASLNRGASRANADYEARQAALQRAAARQGSSQGLHDTPRTRPYGQTTPVAAEYNRRANRGRAPVQRGLAGPHHRGGGGGRRGGPAGRSGHQFNGRWQDPNNGITFGDFHSEPMWVHDSRNSRGGREGSSIPTSPRHRPQQTSRLEGRVGGRASGPDTGHVNSGNALCGRREAASYANTAARALNGSPQQNRSDDRSHPVRSVNEREASGIERTPRSSRPPRR